MQGSGSLGSISDRNNDGGIVHMAASDIFQLIEASTDRDFVVKMSIIEIYNDEVRDLLVTRGGNNTLRVRNLGKRFVVESKERIVKELNDVLSVLLTGEKNRSVGSTDMNERSSRSHTVIRITVESRPKSAEKNDTENDESDEEADNELSNNGTRRISTLTLVDLAGSEGVKRTGQRQKEGVEINQSLLTLGRLITILGDNEPIHIPFNECSLTRILQPSLSGNARIAFICCATPSNLHQEETRSTARFASQVKRVETRPQVNLLESDKSRIKNPKPTRKVEELTKAKEESIFRDCTRAIVNNAEGDTNSRMQVKTDIKPEELNPTSSKIQALEDENRVLNQELQSERDQKAMLLLTNQELESMVDNLASDKEFLKNEKEIVCEVKDKEIKELKALVESLRQKLEEKIGLFESAKKSNDERLKRLVSVNTDSTFRLNIILTPLLNFLEHRQEGIGGPCGMVGEDAAETSGSGRERGIVSYFN
jgi:centromeric protein E